MWRTGGHFYIAATIFPLTLKYSGKSSEKYHMKIHLDGTWKFKVPLFVGAAGLLLVLGIAIYAFSENGFSGLEKLHENAFFTSIAYGSAVLLFGDLVSFVFYVIDRIPSDKTVWPELSQHAHQLKDVWPRLSNQSQKQAEVDTTLDVLLAFSGKISDYGGPHCLDRI